MNEAVSSREKKKKHTTEIPKNTSSSFFSNAHMRISSPNKAYIVKTVIKPVVICESRIFRVTVVQRD